LKDHLSVPFLFSTLKNQGRILKTRYATLWLLVAGYLLPVKDVLPDASGQQPVASSQFLLF